MFDISGFYFHDAAVQTNGVDDPVEAARTISASGWRTTSATSRRASPGLRGRACNLWDISIVKQVRAQRARARAVQRRVPERVQPASSSTTPITGSDERRLRQGDEPEQNLPLRHSASPRRSCSELRRLGDEPSTVGGGEEGRNWTLE